ncbi:MAG: hypothetical protein ACK5EW_01115 [Bacteroidota bacterium]|jgi:hypothetical protein
MQKYLFIFMLCIALKSTAQLSGGFSGIYNFQTESVGLGARALFREQKQIQISPQFAYFLPFNKVHEWTLGVALQYRVVKIGKFQSYALGHVGFNRWINFEDSYMKDAQPNNWNGEVGVGIRVGRNVKSFAEWRYNTKHREASIHIGLLFNKNAFTPKKQKCAAYD